MPSKKEILEYAKQNGFVYPKFKVIFGFVVLGGVIGGNITGHLLFFDDFIKNINNLDVVDFLLSELKFIFGFSFFGIWTGGIPAFLSSLYFPKKEFFIINTKDYFKIFMVGFLITAICALFVVMFGNQQSNIKSSIFDVFIIPLPLAIIGGIPSMICGKLFLPKLPKDFNKGR